MKQQITNKNIILSILLLCLTNFYGIAQVDARLIRYPDVSENEIVFNYGDDLWIVTKDGGVARHLTSPDGEEINPKFSADGKTIAFSGNYDGNTDIYTIPRTGGIPKRITHHPANDFMIDWYPDNRNILYKSRMACSNNKTNLFYKTSITGGFPQKLPLEIGEEASLSPDGKQIAFNMMPVVYGGAWKRYEGGAASEIWVFDLETYDAKNISNFKGVDNYPMWSGNNIYFVSARDKNQKENIWVYNTENEEIRQLTFFTEHDTHFPSLGPKDIVFENGGKLFLLNLETEEIKEVSIEIQFNSLMLRPQQQNVSDLVRNFCISPSGKRIVAEARGELFSLPATEGAVINLTRTSGIAEKYPSWSPDGKQLAYFTDRSGEYQLAIKTINSEESILTKFKNGYRYHPFWSPDGKRIVFIDNKMNVNLYETETGNVSIIDKGLWMTHYGLEGFKVSWSSDSHWICWSRGLENRNNGIFIYNIENKKLHQVSSGFYDDTNPTFDSDGEYLFYQSKRTYNSYNSDIQPTWIFANTSNIVAVPLTKEIPSPLAVKNDEENNTHKNEKRKADVVKIDFEHFEERAVILPIEEGNFASLASVSEKVIYLRLPNTGSTSNQKEKLVYFDIKTGKESTIIEEINAFTLSADKKKIFIQQGRNKCGVIEVEPNQKLEKPVPVGQLEMTIYPQEEWMQMYNEAWRYMRDFFYDPDLHGVDWNAVGERYRKLVPYAGSRNDLNYILTQLYGEVGAGHVGVRGGKIEDPAHKSVGLLGVDFSIDNGAYRIKKIYDSGYRQADYRSPLTEPGINVNEGDYVLAVNGIPLTTDKDPWSAFIGLANETVVLTISNTPKLEGSREITVKTLADDGKLRELDWVRQNREKVFKASSGKLGYIYVTNTSLTGQQELVNQFKAQFHMQGLVIDERFNAGGALGDRFVELLNRPLYGYLAVRNGKHFHMPEVAHPGPMALLTNGWAASGGDGFPYFFQKAGLGPVIGQATMGALVGPNQYMPLIDGGIVSPPPSRIYNMKGEWDGAQTGVIPDIELNNDPESLAKGKDLQLEKAIETVMDLLKGKKDRQPQPEPLDSKWR